MSISKYTIKSNDVIHETNVDLAKRTISMPIYLMQYDNTLPIIAVKLYKNSEIYRIPNDDNIDMYVRWGLRDKNFVYKPILGCNDNRDTVYFAVDELMVFYDGEMNQVLEMVVNESFEDRNIDGITTVNKRTLSSSYIKVIVDRNPIQKTDIQMLYAKYAHIVEKIVPNPTVAGDEPFLNAVGIGAQNYIIGSGGGGNIVPNPTMLEKAPALYGIKVNDEKYNVFSAQTSETDSNNNEIIENIDAIVFVKI